MRKKNIAATLVTVGSCIALLIIALQSAPAAEPLHILIGVPPGGSLDRLARTLGEGYRQQTGQPVVVESKVGANSIIAARACKAAEPDGLTICLLGNDTVSVKPLLYENLGYEPLQDFAPITNVVISQGVVIIKKSLPVNTFQEFVKYSKDHPGTLNYGSLGIGGVSYFLAEWLKQVSGADLTHIPYGGGAPALLAYERGDIDLIYLVASPEIIARIKDGRAKAILVLGDKRNPYIPDVPTITEAGLPRYDLPLYYGLFAPVATPKPIVDKLNGEFVKVIRSKFFYDRALKEPGYETALESTPTEFRKFLEKDRVVNQELLVRLGMKKLKL